MSDSWIVSKLLVQACLYNCYRWTLFSDKRSKHASAPWWGQDKVFVSCPWVWLPIWKEQQEQRRCSDADLAAAIATHAIHWTSCVHCTRYAPFASLLQGNNCLLPYSRPGRGLHTWLTLRSAFNAGSAVWQVTFHISVHMLTGCCHCWLL